MATMAAKPLSSVSMLYCTSKRTQLQSSPMRTPRPFAILTCDEVACPILGTPCHVPRNAKDRNGYVQIYFNGRRIMAHRYTYQREVGPIPPGLVPDHMCRNRACCNADHLRVVTQRTNCTENHARNSATHCPQGHPKTPANYVPRRKLGRISYACLLCARARSKRKPAKPRTIKPQALGTSRLARPKLHELAAADRIAYQVAPALVDGCELSALRYIR